ncbi:MAG: sugar phosphate isomerase/epimerase family protein [Verrucomicrobiota bacterium]
MPPSMTRREFVAGTSAGLLCAAMQLDAAPAFGQRICAFEKPLQFLSYSELADTMAMLGFSGIEATVRAGGHVLPKNVEDDLPRLHDALQNRGLEITIMATDINAADQPQAELVLRTAAKLGIRRYRMQWYRYDARKPILPQLDEIAARLPPLARLTRQLSMSAIYQNHSGAEMVGAPVWDIYRLLKDYDPKTIGIGFDIHHATVEGGLSWPIQFKLIAPNLAAVYVKDFVWEKGKVKSVPLGDGQVDRKFFKMLRESGFTGPICLHVEYLDGKKEDALANAFGKDLATLRSWLKT